MKENAKSKLRGKSDMVDQCIYIEYMLVSIITTLASLSSKDSTRRIPRHLSLPLYFASFGQQGAVCRKKMGSTIAGSLTTGGGRSGK